MIKFKTKNDLIAYKTTATEIVAIGSLGICDECGSKPDYGYLVPVLNHWQCEKCFNEWASRARYYPEDAPYEARRAEYYESMISFVDTSDWKI